MNHNDFQEAYCFAVLPVYCLSTVAAVSVSDD